MGWLLLVVPLLVACGGLGAIVFYGSMAIAAVRYAAWLTSIERKYGLPPKRKSPSEIHTRDNVFYEAVAREIEQRQLNKAVWTRAVADSAGDDNLARSLYIRYRVESLHQESIEKANAEHQARVIEEERQRAQQKHDQEVKARQQAKKSGNAVEIGGLAVIGIVILLSMVAIAAQPEAGQPETPSNIYYPAPHPPAAPTPSIEERQAILTRTLADLNAEYVALAARRASLPPGLSNDQEIAIFNRDAADYTSRVEKFRAEQAELDNR